MSTPTNRLFVIVAAAVASGAAFAQPEIASIDPEEQLRQQIAELQTEEERARPAGLVDPLRALAALYQESGRDALASATLDEARYVTRIHNGLTSADEALLLRQQIRSEKALGNDQRVWDLERDMVTIARHHHDDIRTLPIFRELAEDRLDVIEQVRAGERPPMIYVGCYQGAPLPPYDYTPGEWPPPAPAGSPASLTRCFGGINKDLIVKLRREILMYYADAIEVILRSGDYASPELRQLERAALRVGSGRVRSVLLGKSGGSLLICSGGTLNDYLALEILNSCLAPVVRGRGFVVANVGSLPGLIRLMQYEIRSGAPATARASAVTELADWHVLSTPIDRRRLDIPQVAFALYERAYREIEQSGDLEAPTEMFEPELPVVLPAYEPNPFESAARDSARYIDVSFAVTKYGLGERVRILDTSKNATRAEERELARVIETLSFRPRFVDGKLADSAPVVVRYALDR